jgi:hypothetical protein
MTYEERQRRLDRARFAIQAELQIGLMVVILTGFMAVMLTGFPSVAAPHETPSYLPPFFQLLLLATPVVSLLAWVWMLRLSRPHPEAGERSWRYHDRAA